MEVFEPILRRAESELRVPEPSRSRILLEMASDLDDLYREYRAGGLAEEEARERSVRLLGASSEVISELHRTHASRVAGLLDRLGGAQSSRLESSLVLLTALMVVVGGSYGVFGSSVMAYPTAWSWAVLLLAGTGVWITAAHALALYVRPERLGPCPTEALRALPAIAATCLTTAVVGALVTLIAPAAAGRGSAPSFMVLWRRIGYAAGLSATGLTAALGLCGAWLVLRRRSRDIEEAWRAIRAVFPG